MAFLEILDIERAGFDPNLKAGGSIDMYEGASGSYTLVVQGWALATEGRPATVALRSGDHVLASAPARDPRPDVGLHHPEIIDAAHCGFAITISSLDLPAEFDLIVEVADPAPCVGIGHVRGRRSGLPGDDGAGPQPIMLTTLGRTGSSVLATCLRAHPDILCHGVLPYETRLGAYWVSVFAALSAPRSMAQPLITRGLTHYWWVGDPTLPLHQYTSTDVAYEWMGGENLDELAVTCRERISAFYRWYAVQAGKPGARYFVEKHLPHPDVQARLWEFYPRAREIFLVRDPRDMLASILAFNHKRGDNGFGRNMATSDVEYVENIRDSMVRLCMAWDRRGSGAHLVRYEDLILRESATLTALFEHLGLDASPATMQAVRDGVAATDPHLQARHRTVAEPSATVGRWRPDLAPDVREAAARLLEPALEKFGYLDTPRQD